MPITVGNPITINEVTFEVLKIIDTGGLSTVYLAQNQQTNHKVAIKEFIYQNFYDPITRVNDCAEYWENEVLNTLAQAKSGYPCVRVLHYEQRPNLQTPEYYIVLDYIEGMTFLDFYRKFIQSCRGFEHLDLAGILRNIFIPLAEHLEYCHEHEYIVHRDISVKNIIVIQDQHEDYWPVLIDWGLSKYVGPDWIHYTPKPYISKDMPIDIPVNQKGAPPEIRFGYMPNATSDIYYLAHLMYFVFTGGIMREDSELQSENDYILNPKQINWNVPVKYNEVVKKMTQYEPADRYPNMAEVITRLQELIQINHIHFDFEVFFEQDTDEITGERII